MDGDDVCENSLREENNDFLHKICHSKAAEKLPGQNKTPELGWSPDVFWSSMAMAFDNLGPS